MTLSLKEGKYFFVIYICLYNYPHRVNFYLQEMLMETEINDGITARKMEATT